MQKELEIAVYPRYINDYSYQKKLIAKILKINFAEIKGIRIIRKSVDARSKRPVFKLKLITYINEFPKEERTKIDFLHVKNNKKVIIVGSGPAGLFAALKLIEFGIKPIIFERGKDVQNRRKDLRLILQKQIINPNSNYCFGEGGAGTYSDGKLYTRSKKRGDVLRILNLLVQHGAQNEILIDAHPHIGSNLLPKIIAKITKTITDFGGEIHFGSLVTNLLVNEEAIKGVIVNNEKEYNSDAVILATGHSARDIYYLLDKHSIKLEAKDFAMGVRVEHPQALIDSIQYHTRVRHKNLPAASYNIACQIDKKGVYTFCMCPGGMVIPAATSPGELVLNGMSLSRRNSPFANSGIVVSVSEPDWLKFKEYGVFAGLKLQQEFEKKSFIASGKTQCAPAQRITDFVKNKISNSLPSTSYIPGTTSVLLDDILPGTISLRLRKAIKIFDNRMRGFYTDEAQLLAPESRTSSPIRIPRDKETLMHIQTKGLFPAGEGAGYAGGIVSSAIDGEKVAEKTVNFLNRNL